MLRPRVGDLDHRAAGQRLVGDADELLRQLLPARGRVAVEPGAVPGGHARLEDAHGDLGRGARHARRAAALERRPDPLLAEHLRAPADAVAALAPDRRAGLRAPGLGGLVEALHAQDAAAGAARHGAGEHAPRGRAAPAATRRARRRRRAGAAGRSAARRLRGRARGQREGDGHEGRQQPGRGNEPHRCFLRCLRGELTGSRRESSATDVWYVRFAPVARRPHWVPRSPR